MDIREKLKDLREEYNISIQQISDNISVDTDKIEKIESGKRLRNDVVFYAYKYFLLNETRKREIDKLEKKTKKEVNALRQELKEIMSEHYAIKADLQEMAYAEEKEEDYKYLN